MPPATRPERRRDPAAAVSFQRIAVVGGGAWGTALANAAALAGREVCFWMRDPDRARSLREARENARYLPGVRLHERVRPSADLADLADADAALLVVPAQTVRAADRKSTRLNSSHTVISYAVFCLKKKKTLYPIQNNLKHLRTTTNTKT